MRRRKFELKAEQRSIFMCNIYKSRKCLFSILYLLNTIIITKGKVCIVSVSRDIF